MKGGKDKRCWPNASPQHICYFKQVRLQFLVELDAWWVYLLDLLIVIRSEFRCALILAARASVCLSEYISANESESLLAKSNGVERWLQLLLKLLYWVAVIGCQNWFLGPLNIITLHSWVPNLPSACRKFGFCLPELCYNVLNPETVSTTDLS